MLPEDEKVEQASVCTHTLFLLLRLSCYLAFIVSRKKESQNIERTKKKREKKQGNAIFQM